MPYERLIDLILARQPEPVSPVPGPIEFHPLVTQFGYLHLGICDEWVWFDKRATYKGEPRFSLKPGQRFLQDASEDELLELAALVGP